MPSTADVPIRIVNFSTRRHRFFELSLLSDIKNLLLIKFIIYLRREAVVCRRQIYDLNM